MLDGKADACYNFNLRGYILRILACKPGGFSRDLGTCFPGESRRREAVPQSDPGRTRQAGVSRL